jgi:hypothetical protein
VAITYSQDWSSGNSLFTSIIDYERGTNGVDPLYPEIVSADTCTINGDGHLDWNPAQGDYQDVGVAIRGHASTNAQTGSITVRYIPNTTAISDFGAAGTANLFTVVENVSTENVRVWWGPVEGDESGTIPGIYLELADWNGFSSNHVARLPWNPSTLVDTEVTIRACWSCATVEGVTFENDGWFRLYINGTLFYEVEDIALYINSGSGPGLNYLEEVWVGFFGLLGENTYVEFNDESCETVDNPPGGGTCCGSTGPGGAPPSTGFGPPGDQPPVTTPRVIPPGGEEPGYAPCSTGGDPATASDPAEPQTLTDARSPVFWLRLTLPDATVLRYNSQGLNFTSGNGETSTPRVIQGGWGDIGHALSDDYGSFEAFRTSVTLSDADGVIRGHLSHATNRHIDGREAIIYVETRANAALGTAPKVAGRGVITSWRSNADLTVTIEIADPLGNRYASVALDRPFPYRRIGANFFPSCPDQNLNRAVPYIYGDYSDDFTWSVDPRRTPVGICPVIHIGPASTINGLGVGGMDDAFLIAGHAIAGVQSLFGSNNHEDGPGSVRLPLGSAEFRLPGVGGWPLYHDITGADGQVERFAIMTGIGPRSDAHVNGQVPITLNVCGIEDVGDGSGDTITNLVSQVQHFIQHLVLANPKTGTWGAVPTFASSTTPKVRTTSFNTARTTINNRIGGYVGAFYIGDQKSTREWLAQLCVGSDLRVGINHHGQIVVATLDDQASTAGLTTYTTAHIEASTFDIDPRIEDIYNVVEFQCGVEAATGRFAWPATTLRNESSVTTHGERIAQPITVMTTQIHAYAMDIANRRLLRASQPRARVRFTVDLRGLALSLGQLISVTHFAGIGATGWTTRTLWVQKITTDPNEDTMLVTIDAEDVQDILGATQALIDAGTLDTAVLA